MNFSIMRAASMFPESFVRNMSRQVLVFKKNSPHIFFGLGIAGTIGSTVLACRATLKVSETLDEIKEDVDTVKEMQDAIDTSEMIQINAETNQMEKAVYTREDWYKDTLYVYGKSGLKLVKLYGPSIILGTVSIVALSGSHVQLARRNTALMAAYAALHQAFEEYRDRVRYQYGEDREIDLYRGTRAEIKQMPDGDKVETKVLGDPNKLSVYARFFDEGSQNWQKNPELNRLYVQCQQNIANHLLNARGHIFLNEVYDMLDIPRSSAGSVIGWVRNNPDGDSYVSFGLFEPGSAHFVNGIERSILLDFNVDGVIYDKI
jgi:hypothetical protein